MRDIVVQLQEERGGDLWGLARHLGLTPDESDDAVQETHPNWPAAVPVAIPAGGLDPVPDCLGSNAPSSLSLTYLQPQT